MLTPINPPPWTAWNLAGVNGQPTRPTTAAPGSALAGPEAEDPDPPDQGAADAPAVLAAPRPSDLPASQRVGRPAAGELPDQPADRRPRQGGIDLYV